MTGLFAVFASCILLIYGGKLVFSKYLRYLVQFHDRVNICFKCHIIYYHPGQYPRPVIPSM